VFQTASLALFELSVCLAVSTVPFIAVEIEKLLIRRGVLCREPAWRSD